MDSYYRTLCTYKQFQYGVKHDKEHNISKVYLLGHQLFQKANKTLSGQRGRCLFGEERLCVYHDYCSFVALCSSSARLHP